MEEADPKSIGGAPKTGNYVAKSFDSKSTAGAPKTGNSVAKSSGSKTTAGAPKTGNSAPKSSESKLSKSKSLKPKVPPQAKKSSAQPVSSSQFTSSAPSALFTQVTDLISKKKNAPSANALAREEPPKDPYRFIFGTTLSSSEESDEGDPELFAEPRPKKIKEKKRQSSSLKTLPGGVPLAPGAVNPQQHFELLQAQQGYAVQQTPQNRIPIPSAAQLLQQQGYEHASQNRVPKSHPAQLANQQGYAVQNAPQHPLFTPQPAQPPHQQGHAVQHAPQIPVAVQQPAQPANQHQVNFETLRQAAAGARYPPHIWNPNRMAQFGNAFLFHQERLKSLAQQQDLSPEDEENLRLYKAAADTMMNFARNHKRPAEDENEQAAIPEPAPASAPAAPAAKTELDHDDLAISKIRRATKDKPCTFCKFKCDFGVSNDDALMSKDASSGYCEECDLANSQSEFYQLWMSEPRYKKAIGRRGTKDQRVVGNENDDTAAGLEAGAGDEKVFSKIDGADITKYMKPMFCQYWHQVDVHKVRICDDCRVEKLLVIGHANRKSIPS